MRIGIFGGTFNPIHIGHLRMAEESCELMGLDKVIFVPSGNPPLKSREILNSKDRYKIVKKAISKNDLFHVSPIEISKKSRSYTVQTVQKMQQLYGDNELFLIMGIDAFCDLHLWFSPNMLIGMVDFIVLMRYGNDFKQLLNSQYISNKSKRKIEQMKSFDNKILICNLKSKKKMYLLNTTALNVSSTMIREGLKKGQSVRYLVPESVYREICEKYRD